MKSNQELAKHLYSLEQSLLDPAVRQSSAVYDLLADGFGEFGSSEETFDETQVIVALQQSSPNDHHSYRQAGNTTGERSCSRHLSCLSRRGTVSSFPWQLNMAAPRREVADCPASGHSDRSQLENEVETSLETRRALCAWILSVLIIKQMDSER